MPMIGLSRRAYAKKWSVDESAIRKAIVRGEVFLHSDGSVGVQTSDQIWGRQHELNMAIGYGDHRLRPADTLNDPAVGAAFARGDWTEVLRLLEPTPEEKAASEAWFAEAAAWCQQFLKGDG